MSIQPEGDGKMAKLTGKVAVVSGASKGIGASIAEELAKEGASVIVNYSSSPAQAEAVVKRIQAGGGAAKAVKADLSKPGEARKLIEAAVAEFGKLDILVNNAGIYKFVPLDQIDEKHYDSIFELNVKGLLFATQAAARAFGENGGTVINISSVVSLSAVPTASVYSATKAAVDSLTRTLAAELGPKGIRVNSVLPGPVETEGTSALDGFEQFREAFVPQTPLRRIGQPHDIATAVSFLASADSGWITGQVIPVSGGLR
jgi:3-oxoacyl-[acyl-carrier protein] reductase